MMKCKIPIPKSISQEILTSSEHTSYFLQMTHTPLFGLTQTTFDSYLNQLCFPHQRDDLHVLVSVLSNHSVSISSTSHAHVRSVFAVGAAGIASIALLKKHLRAQEPESGYLYTWFVSFTNSIMH